jgi:hypothetical protein
MGNYIRKKALFRKYFTIQANEIYERKQDGLSIGLRQSMEYT